MGAGGPNATAGAEGGARVSSKLISTPGEDRLWGWFELSYASFLVLPRVLLHEMTDEWQGRLVDLLNEYDDTFPNQPDIGSRVNAVNTRTSKMTKWPAWVLNYRRPMRDDIDALRPKGTQP